jgi:hypothetical protein
MRHRLRYKILRGPAGDVSIVLSLGGQHHLYSGERALQLMETVDELAIDFTRAQMEEDDRKLSWRKESGGS